MSYALVSFLLNQKFSEILININFNYFVIFQQKTFSPSSFAPKYKSELTKCENWKCYKISRVSKQAKPRSKQQSTVGCHSSNENDKTVIYSQFINVIKHPLHLWGLLKGWHHSKCFWHKSKVCSEAYAFGNSKWSALLILSLLPILHCIEVSVCFCGSLQKWKSILINFKQWLGKYTDVCWKVAPSRYQFFCVHRKKNTVHDALKKVWLFAAVILFIVSVSLVSESWCCNLSFKLHNARQFWNFNCQSLLLYSTSRPCSFNTLHCVLYNSGDKWSYKNSSKIKRFYEEEGEKSEKASREKAFLRGNSFSFLQTRQWTQPSYS